MRSIWDRAIDKFTVGDGCWEWTGAKATTGYGRMSVGRRGEGLAQAHRLVYELLIGPIPDGLVTDHLCRNRACVNPMHIELVTHRVNILRGTGASARNARVTHCPYGHEYTPENTRYQRGGWRHCRACTRAWIARRAVHNASLPTATGKVEP